MMLNNGSNYEKHETTQEVKVKNVRHKGKELKKMIRLISLRTFKIAKLHQPRRK